MASDTTPPRESVITSQLLEQLSTTQYATSSLTRLAGGFANFTFRARLLQPLSDGSKSVIIKHSASHSARNAAWALDVERSEHEASMLVAVSALPPTEYGGVRVDTPDMYLHDPQAHMHVLRDYTGTIDLKAYLSTLKTTNTVSLPSSQISALGTALGRWSRRFHEWGAAPEQAPLRAPTKVQTVMMKLRFEYNYGKLMETVGLWPGVLDGYQSTFVDLEKRLQKEMDEGKWEGSLIHGDFWCGNILIPCDPTATTPIPLTILDWEVSSPGPISNDLGQLFAELYLLTHFRDIDAGSEIITAVMQGYGRVDHDTAVRIAVQFGTHLVVWPCRVPGWGEGKIMESCVKLGAESIKRAEEGDIDWFKGGVLHSVFFGEGIENN